MKTPEQAQITKSPREWAAVKGHIVKPKKPGQAEHFGWQFAAAETVHGWREHAHHTGAPMQLTEQDYDAAIAAVCNPKGNPIAHTPALSQYAQR
jgi:hypothetical protein